MANSNLKHAQENVREAHLRIYKISSLSELKTEYSIKHQAPPLKS